MNVCSFTYVFLQEFVTRVVTLYSLIAVAWRQCSEQRCRWWCLCCNKWLCWIALIISVILVTILLVVVVLIGVALVTACWLICIFLFIFSFGGNMGKASINCFAKDPVPPPPPPLPTVIITEPPRGVPARYHPPDEQIALSAVAADVDGSPLTGPALEWFDSYPGVVDQLLGQGESISVMLVLRPEDTQAGRATEHLVSVVATGTGGQKSLPSRATVNIISRIG
jgi:hypothetical protein